MKYHLNKIETEGNQPQGTPHETEVDQEGTETPQPSLRRSGQLGT